VCVCVLSIYTKISRIHIYISTYLSIYNSLAVADRDESERMVLHRRRCLPRARWLVPCPSKHSAKRRVREQACASARAPANERERERERKRGGGAIRESEEDERRHVRASERVLLLLCGSQAQPSTHREEDRRCTSVRSLEPSVPPITSTVSPSGMLHAAWPNLARGAQAPVCCNLRSRRKGARFAAGSGRGRRRGLARG